MKEISKKILVTLILVFGLFLIIGNNSVFASTVIPTEYTTVYTNTNNNITNNIEDGFGVFKFTNYGARFVKVTLTATSSQSSLYPNGCFSVKNSNYQLIEKCDIIGFDSYAINSEGINYLNVFLPTSGSYYIEINYDMTNVTKLELSISVINTSYNLNIFDYNDSEEFITDFMINSTDKEAVKQFTLSQATQFKVDVSFDNTLTSGCRIILIKINSANSDELIVTKINQIITDDYSITTNLVEGTYCIGYFGLSNDSIDLTMTRNITSYGSTVLVPDPDRATNCGSQITVEESNIAVYNRSYRQNSITEGFTRLIYLDDNAPSTSRLDYYWYSSDEYVAKITDYGTVLAMPISTTQESVKVMAVYKYDMSKCYIKEFVVKNDNDTYLTNPIDIDVSMSVTPNRYTSIDLSEVDVPVNLLQYYTWSSTSDVHVDGWGRVYAYNSALGKTVDIVGTYQYNPKVKIKLSVYVILPTSGSEIAYNPEAWNYSPVQYETNCYAYAFNTQVYPNTNNLCYMQPGAASGTGESLTQSQITLQNVIDKVEIDAELMGFTFQEISKYERCDNGTYKVALVVDNSVDYHWYRQNPDGTWSHKLAWTEVTNLDASDNVIYDPELCDKDYTSIGGGNYVDGIKFFQVTPINNFYQSTIEQVNTQQVMTLDSNLNIEIGMTIEEVNSVLGSPNRPLTSGLMILEYVTENVTYHISYKTLVNGSCIVTHINKLNND